MRLTEAKIRAAKPRTNAAGKLADNWISDGGGLYLRVLPSSLKCWMIRRKLNGKALPPVRLGNYPSMSLKEARHEATGYQLQKDVSTATVADLVKRYRLLILSHHRRPRMFGGYIDRSILPALGARRVRDITTAELVNLIQNYGTHKRGTTGDRARDQFRSMLKQMFGLAVEIGWRTDNPAAAITSRVTGYSYQPRERILTCDEVRKLWSETSVNARVLRFPVTDGCSYQ